jgi:hypothetical protein
MEIKESFLLIMHLENDIRKGRRNIRDKNNEKKRQREMVNVSYRVILYNEYLPYIIQGTSLLPWISALSVYY